MRRIAIFRDGSKMGAMIGPDLVEGLGGFGDTCTRRLRDLAAGFIQYGYQLRVNIVVVEVEGRSIQGGPAPTAAAAIRGLADMLARLSQTRTSFSHAEGCTPGSDALECLD